MPWDIRIVNGSPDAPEPLGRRDDVIAAFAEALPGVTLAPPPLPPAEFLVDMPPDVRAAMLRPRLEADFEADDLSIQFYADDAPVLHRVSAEVRGNGDPRPPLAALCAKRGWSVIDLSTGSPVDLSPTANPTEWDRFRHWRDRTIDDLRGSA